MTDDREDLLLSWERTATHLNAARNLVASVNGVDLVWVDEFLRDNELGLAFDTLVDLGDELEMPIDYWKILDQAAREMQLYSAGPGSPYLAAAAMCRRHVATG